jgi:uncharacterized protein (DUF1015 family)
VYTRAAGYFRKWRAEGVLAQDKEPSIYLYSQRFTRPGTEQVLERAGFIALSQVHDYEDRVIFRHEQTLSKPKADRLELLRATRAHFGQIFVLYSDPGRSVERALATTGAPDMDIRDEYGVQHRVWRVSDAGAIGKVQEVMGDKKLIIADGHHRYETALAYRNEQRAASGREGRMQAASEAGARGSSAQATATMEASEAPSERVMMTFVNMDSEGLVILPTHRVVHGLENFDGARLRTLAGSYFEVEEAPREARALVARLAEAGREGSVMAAVTAKEALLLRLRPGSTDALLAGFSQRQRQLDVVQLHKVVLEHLLKISEEDIRNQKHVVYEREAGEAIGRVQRGANAAFLMNPVPMAQMRDVAFAGEVLPQKSTDFYPKMLTGLTMYALD